MAEIEDIESWIGADVLDPADDRIGKLDDVIIDSASGSPAYGVTKSGLLARRSLVPLQGASFSRGYVRVPVSAEQISSAPVDAADEVSPEDHALLSRHYGTADDQAASDTTGDQPRRFESVKIVADRDRKATADLARAEELEAEAAKRHEKSGSLHQAAQERDAEAAAIDAERDRLLDEAAEARARAEGRPPEGTPF